MLPEQYNEAMPGLTRSFALRRKKLYLNLSKQFAPPNRRRGMRPKTPFQRWMEYRKAHHKIALGVMQPFRPLNHTPQLDRPINAGPNPNLSNEDTWGPNLGHPCLN